jgi:hypothetical protein
MCALGLDHRELIAPGHIICLNGTQSARGTVHLGVGL